MKHIFSVIFALLLLGGTINAQIVERSVEGIEYLQTNDELVYQGVHIPVLDIGYHEFSDDSLTWRKEYVSGDCYMRFANTTSNTTSPYTSKQGYHDDWFVLNICNLGGGDGTSQIDTIVVCSDGVCDTITTGLARISIPAPLTITGTTSNTSTDTTHTHELLLYMGEIENVDTTGVANGQVIKWNSVSKMWVAANDLTGAGASGELTVKEVDGTPDVSNVTEIQVENGHLVDNGDGSVTISFDLEPVNGAQDFYRTDTVNVVAGDTFLTFSSPLSANDYVVVNAYALYSNGERQNLSYDSTAADGFRVLDVIGESEVHYLVARDLDSLFLAISDQGKILASATDGALNYLDSKTDDTTIVVLNNELTVLKAPTADSVPEENVYISSDLGEETLQKYLSHVGTPHVGSGTTITDLGNDSISISQGQVYMKTSNSADALFMSVIVPADTLYVPQDSNFLVLVDYNSGAPYYRLQATQVGYLYDNWDELPLASVVNVGYRIIENSFEQETLNPLYRTILSQINYEPVRYVGGLEVTDEGTRQFSVAVGAVIFANTNEIVMPINTSTVDTFTRIYYDGGWMRVNGETTINNTHYNDTAQGLVALTPNYYTYKWLFYVKDSPNYWVVLDGQSQELSYTRATSVTEPASLPPELNQFYAGAILVGKIIVQEGKSEIIKIQNPFSDTYGVPSQAIAKSYSFTSQGIGVGTYYAGGFYDVSTTDANLTQASLTQTYVAANRSHASHPFIVAGGAGTATGGVVGLRVTGTRIQDDGTRTANYADTIITDITAMSLNQYVEADKFIGTVTYQLITISGTPTTYSFDFNYGLVKYEDFGNSDFDMSGVEAVGLAGAADASFNVTLIHHNSSNWVYAATGFAITPDKIFDLRTIHGTESNLVSGKYFAFKVTPITYGSVINGSDSEGIIIRIVAGANNSVQSMNMHVSARLIE